MRKKALKIKDKTGICPILPILPPLPTPVIKVRFLVPNLCTKGCHDGRPTAWSAATAEGDLPH